MSQKLLECNICKKNGFPGVQFYFAGKDANGWIMRNPDDSAHVHKEAAKPPPVRVIEPPAATPETNRGEYTDLVMAIRDLAQAIREMKA